MTRNSELQSAFDAAIAQVQACLSAGMTTESGESAQPQLEELERELRNQRQHVVEGGAFDQAWFQKTLRALVDWLPDTELTLIAALGRIARARPTTTT